MDIAAVFLVLIEMFGPSLVKLLEDCLAPEQAVDTLRKFGFRVQIVAARIGREEAKARGLRGRAKRQFVDEYVDEKRRFCRHEATDAELLAFVDELRARYEDSLEAADDLRDEEQTLRQSMTETLAARREREVGELKNS